MVLRRDLLGRRDAAEEREVHADLLSQRHDAALEGGIPGRKAIRLKEIEDTTGLKAGNRADPSQTRRAVSQIQELYREKGYDLASVTLLEGGNHGDTKIVIEVFEGPKAKVTSIEFKGNSFASAATLKTHINTRSTILGLFGRYDADMLENDREKLVEYYIERVFRGKSRAGHALDGETGRDRADICDFRGNPVPGANVIVEETGASRPKLCAKTSSCSRVSRSCWRSGTRTSSGC